MLRKFKKKKQYDIEEELQSEDYYAVLEEALRAKAENTIAEQIKCKNKDEMKDLSIRYVTEIELANRAKDTVGVDFYCSDEEAIIIIQAINEFKDTCNDILKKALNNSEPTDTLCKYVYICNDVLKIFANDMDTKDINLNEGE